MSKPPSAAARSAADVRNLNTGGYQNQQLPSSPSPSLTGGGGDNNNGNAIPPMTPEKELYPRRFPRIGSQFQTRISKSTEPSDRPTPMLLSTDFPYLTSEDVRNEQRKLTEDGSPPIQKQLPLVEESETENATTNGQNGRWAKLSDSNNNNNNNGLPQAIFGVPEHRQTSTTIVEPIDSNARGGILLHRPIDNMEEYTSFCQPLLSTLPPDVRQVTLTDQASWKQHMIQLTHQSEQAAALALAAAGGGGRGSGKAKRSNRSARGGTKRKRELVLQSQTSSVSTSSDGGGRTTTSGNDSSSNNNDDDNNTSNNENEGDQMVWTLEEMLEKQREDNENTIIINNSNDNYGNSRKRRTGSTRNSGGDSPSSSSDNNSYNNGVLLLGGEEEARVMEHLHATAGGDVDVGKFSILVQFTAGQGVKMRKTREKKWAKNRPRSVVLHPTTGTWRDLYQKMQFPSLLGQLQDDEELRFMVNGQSISDSSTDDTGGDYQEDDYGAYETEDDLKDTWRSILTCAKSIERQLTGHGQPGRKPYLSTILTFVSNAYNLPPPEECFGTNHVMIEELSSSFVTILHEAEKAQEAAAKLRDKTHSSSAEGIESGALLKLLDTEFDPIPVRLHEVDKLRSYQSIVVEWEGRVASMLEHDDEEVFNPDSGNTLEAAEKLKEEAKSHGYFSQALVQLDSRIKKAYDLRSRIVRWKETCQGGSLGSTKTLNALIKEANRIKLIFQEVSEIVEIHAKIEAWIDRANVALRSKISLAEIKELLSRANELSVDLSEHEEKLNSRASCADDWFSSLKETIEVPVDDNGEIDMFELLKNFQHMLVDGGHGQLHDLALEGSRIPVDVDAVKLLQVAMDAKIWTTKAEKWIPTSDDSKKGKLADVREHADKALDLRERLPLSEDHKEAWVLQGEKELDDVVESADTWYEKYAPYLEGDKRRTGDRKSISVSKLRTIVDEGDAVFANLGNSTLKMSRILAQADSWYNEHLSVLRICKLAPHDDSNGDSSKQTTTHPEDISKAVDAAKADVSLELEEAVNLRSMIEKIEHWKEQVSLVAPKRTKRNGKANRPKLTFDDLIRLIDEAASLPIDTAEDVQRLQMQLSNVQVWRSHATAELEKIISGFGQLESNVNSLYGEPNEFSLEQLTSKSSGNAEDTEDDDKSKASGCESTEQSGGNIQLMQETAMDIDNSASSVGGSDVGDAMIAEDSNGDVNIFRAIRELQDSAKDNGVTTPEGDMGDLLHDVAQWCLRSFKYLNTPRDIFDKRFFGAFDRFLTDGEAFTKDAEESIAHSNGLSVSARNSWKQLVLDQLTRLGELKMEREKFVQWCKNATQMLGDEKLTKEQLDDLAKSSRLFPAGSDVVGKVRSLATKVSKWVENVQEHLQSENKLDMQDVKALIDSGEKLKCNTQELKTLRSGLRAAKAWSNRVSKCNIGQATVHVDDIEHLIAEHDSLLIEMPDELDELKEATVGYCLCRRPYEGFMIGCDHCDEWYHGPCIGITESRAERFEKFSCIRCSAKKCFEMSANTAVGLVRKWTCKKDLKKARQVENQKVQRKFRKEKKDIEKYELVIKEAENTLLAIGKKTTTDMDTSAIPVSLPVSDTDHTDSVSSIVPTDAVAVSTPSITPVNPATEANSTTPAHRPNGVSSVGATAVSGATVTEVSNSSKNTETSKDAETTDAAPPPSSAPSATTEQLPTLPVSDEKITEETKTPEKPPETKTEEEIRALLEKTKNYINSAKTRLEAINQIMRERKLAEKKEDEYAAVFRRFFLLVRSHVLVPSQHTTAHASQPLFGAKLSSPMVALSSDSRDLGISDFPDVEALFNSFRCMTWSLSVMAILQRKPHLSEVTFLMNVAENLKLPDEKVLRTMKFMENRITQFQSKVKKILAPADGDGKAKSNNTEQLHDLLYEKSELPLDIPDIQDRNTHPLEEQPSGDSSPFESYRSVGRAISHAPDPKLCWPPFGLLSSTTAIEALGLECARIPDPSDDPAPSVTAHAPGINMAVDTGGPSPAVTGVAHVLSESLTNGVTGTSQPISTSASVPTAPVHPTNMLSNPEAVSLPAADPRTKVEDKQDIVKRDEEEAQQAKPVVDSKTEPDSRPVIATDAAATTATIESSVLSKDYTQNNAEDKAHSMATGPKPNENGGAPIVDGGSVTSANVKGPEHIDHSANSEITIKPELKAADSSPEDLATEQPTKNDESTVQQTTVSPVTEATAANSAVPADNIESSPEFPASTSMEVSTSTDTSSSTKKNVDTSLESHCSSKTVSQSGSPEQQNGETATDFKEADPNSTLCNGSLPLDKFPAPHFTEGIRVMSKDTNA